MSWSLTWREDSADRRARVHARIAVSDDLAHAAWRRIAASYKRLNLRHPIAGASGNDEDVRRESVRRRLASGALPRLEGAAWAGLALGDHRCACCHETIRARQIEYEPRDQGAAVYAHVQCFAIWLSESRLTAAPRQSLSRHPSEPPPPLGRAG